MKTRWSSSPKSRVMAPKPPSLINRKEDPTDPLSRVVNFPLHRG